MSSAPTATSVPAQGSNTTNSPQQNSNRPNGQASRRGGNRGGHNSKDQRGNWGRGRGQRGGRGGGSTGGRDHAPNPHIDAATRSAPPLSPSAIPDRSGVSDSRPIKDAPANVGVGEGERSLSQEDEVEAEVCFICASPVIHNSVAPCNHRTCHICALRLRALYKTRACAHCRVSLVLELLDRFMFCSHQLRQKRNSLYLPMIRQSGMRISLKRISSRQMMCSVSNMKAMTSTMIHGCYCDTTALGKIAMLPAGDGLIFTGTSRAPTKKSCAICARGIKRSSRTSMNCSLHNHFVNTRNSATIIQVPLTKVDSRGIRSAVSVYNGSTATTSSTLTVEISMKDVTSVTEEIKVGSSSITKTIMH